MIKNELRLGNYLMYDKKLIYISEITKVGIGMYDGYGFDKNSPIECLKPIPLTKEWIDKFKKTGFNIFWANLSKDVDGFFVWVSGYKIYIKNVHNFQNIYFALTGEELNRVEGF